MQLSPSPETAARTQVQAGPDTAPGTGPDMVPDTAPDMVPDSRPNAGPDTRPATAPGADPAPRPDAGFSLLELMVVVVILSILALVIVPRVIDRPDQARAARARADIAAIASAVNLYRLDNVRYPTTEQGLAALVARPGSEPQPRNWAAGGYMDRLPVDPWGQPYQYLAPGVHGDFDVFTYGADGVAGGQGADADIGSWDSN